MTSITSVDSKVYYKETYWDAFPQGKAYTQFQATGDVRLNSQTHFKKKYCKKPFKHALFLNCGNGWLERWFLKNHMVFKVTAFDCSQPLIDEANKKKKKLPITYFVADANTIELPENTYDLVVNSAALHHVQYINRLCHQIARSMKPNGIFFNYDYIGPHRNQYAKRHWDMIQEINNSLPKSIRKDPLLYAHIPTMLATDPSEAIHSELIVPTLDRYFTTIERHDVSGMIAYNLLSLNPKLKRGDRNKHIERIIKADQDAYKKNKIPPLFTYWVTRPNKNILRKADLLRKWQLSENVRERIATIIEYTYSPQEYFPVLVRKPIQRTFRLVTFLIAQIFSFFVLKIYFTFF